ncbi:hypothetical protein ACRRTK_013334 [Alexandromys fortis]
MVLLSSAVWEDGWRLEVDGHKVFLSARESLCFLKKRSGVIGVVCILLHVWQFCDCLECSKDGIEIVEVVILSLRVERPHPPPSSAWCMS